MSKPVHIPKRPFQHAMRFMNGELRRGHKGKSGVPPKVKIVTLKAVFQRDRGRCRICGIPILATAERIITRPHFGYFIPIKNGGNTKPDNLLTLCPDCKNFRRPLQRKVQRMASGGTIADLIEKLAQQVQKLALLESKKYEEHVSQKPDAKKIAELDRLHLECKTLKTQLKQELDDSLAEMVDISYYRPVTEKDMEIPKFILSKNTIAEKVEEIVETTSKPAMHDNATIVKAEVAEALEQIVEQKKYVILQPESDEDTG